MSALKSLKRINELKAKAIKNGGYEKFKNQLSTLCELHRAEFGVDFYPKHLEKVIFSKPN